MKPPSDYADLLNRPLFAHVAVTGPHGAPRTYPMWFGYCDDIVSLTNTATRPQTRALRADSMAAMSVIDPQRPYRYLGAQLRLIEIVPDPDGTFFYKLADRYDLDITLDDPTDRVVLRLATETFWKQ